VSSAANLLPEAGIITVDQFLEMDLPDTCEWELLDGTVVSLTFPNFEHSLLQRHIFELFQTMTVALLSVHMELPYRLRQHRAHRADVAVISLEAEKTIVRRKILDGAPLFVIEILSDSNRKRPYKLEELRTRCFEEGCKLFWQVDARSRTIEVFTQASNHVLYERNEKIPLVVIGAASDISANRVFEVLD
jgi:Uma2 family endonuclease